jgi:hypothetical protein
VSPRDRGQEDKEDRYTLEVNGRVWGRNYNRADGVAKANQEGPKAQKVKLTKAREGKTPVTVIVWVNGTRQK